MFAHTPVALATAYGVALASAAVLWPVVGHQTLLLWLVVLGMVTLGRLVLVRRAQRIGVAPGTARSWCLLYVLGCLLSGLVWGFSMLWLDASWPLQQQVFLLFALAGITSGAISSHAVVYPAYLAFLLPATLPLSAHLMLLDQRMYTTMGLLLVLYTVAVTIIARLQHEAVRRYLELGIENEGLVRLLSETNRRLSGEAASRQQALVALEREQRLFLEGPVVMFRCLTDDGWPIVHISRTVSQFGFDAAQLMADRTPFASLVHPDDLPALTDSDFVAGEYSGLPVLEQDYRLVLPDGTIRWVYDYTTRMSGRAGEPDYYEGYLIDITARKRAERALIEEKERLAFQASHDPLTGLMNRREFERKVDEALCQARNTGATYCVCYMDLDQFKIVNDSCGHFAGDELLRQLASELPRMLREGDIFARLGGDEFGLLLEHCDTTQATEVADSIRKRIQASCFVWEGRLFGIGASIGIVQVNADSEDVAAILSAADIACYTAKEQGRDQVYVYHGADSEPGRRLSEIRFVSRIRGALDEGRMLLYYQPIRPLAASCDAGEFGEVLVRMRDEDGEILLPDLFLPAAERYNLMPAVDLWVIESTLRWLSAAGGKAAGQTLSVNLSGHSLGSSGFCNRVLALIDLYRVGGERLCFEITETAAIMNFTAAGDFIARLRERGCRFALDDFGSGLSSFSYLKKLPVDFLKIDGSLVREMAEDSIAFEMVRSIHQLGHVLGVRTIAEFVENEAIWEKLSALGIDYVQGCAVAAPVPLEEMIR